MVRGPARGLLVGLALACAPPGPGDYERREGDGCGDRYSECVDEVTLWDCVERRWELVDCTEVCEGRGGVSGCLEDPDLPRGARCLCEEDAPECTPEQAWCSSDEVLRECDPDTLRWKESRCDEVCGAMTPAQRAAGCSSDWCDCTLVGTPCGSDDPPRCQAYALAVCVDGRWTEEHCPCSPGKCDPFAPGGPACDC